VIVTGVETATLDVDVGNVALVAPAAIVTVAGTLAADVLLLESEMTAPPGGAPVESVTLPWELAPPVTLVGFTVTACRLAAGGTRVTVRVAVRLVPL
jgi:hypothetical protein